MKRNPVRRCAKRAGASFSYIVKKKECWGKMKLTTDRYASRFGKYCIGLKMGMCISGRRVVVHR